MNVGELDAEWAQTLSEAERRARAAGRSDVGDYLALRAANDQARAAGIKWLIETFTRLAGEANRVGAGINVERDEAHRFSVGDATMIGTRLVLRVGLRALTIEAGWPRAPADGIVRGGGLANAKVSHFGNSAANDKLLLVRTDKDGAPQWLVLEPIGSRTEFLERCISNHINKLLDR